MDKSNTMEINKIIQGDCIEKLKELPDSCVDCCVTSPPYYGLRDYGTATWEGGDQNCDHKGNAQATRKNIHDRTQPQCNNKPDENVFEIYKTTCGKCGAIRVDNQVGLEETPEAYVQKLVDVFREVKRVLKPEGTLWLNLGDSYFGSGGASGQSPEHLNFGKTREDRAYASEGITRKLKSDYLKPKDLIGIPWMVAFALRADGWYLRQDIIWNKPNPMPESVTDRCTKAHEYIFLLSKSQQYYYDYEALREKAITKPHKMGGKQTSADRNDGDRQSVVIGDGFANKRSVWTVTTKPFSEAHFATFPEDLIVPCIKAGCPEKGIVIDPFMGAGTTGLVARKLTRNFVGIELNPEYIKIAENRIRPHLQQVSMFDLL